MYVTGIDINRTAPSIIQYDVDEGIVSTISNGSTSRYSIKYTTTTSTMPRIQQRVQRKPQRKRKKSRFLISLNQQK